MICAFMLFGASHGISYLPTLTTWELVVALLTSLQLILFASIEQLIHSHLPNHLRQRWISTLIQGCVFALLLILAFLLLSPVWNHDLLIVQMPFVAAVEIAMIVIMIWLNKDRVTMAKPSPGSHRKLYQKEGQQSEDGDDTAGNAVHPE